jgi:hypothetical protein
MLQFVRKSIFNFCKKDLTSEGIFSSQQGKLF